MLATSPYVALRDYVYTPARPSPPSPRRGQHPQTFFAAAAMSPSTTPSNEQRSQMVDSSTTTIPPRSSRRIDPPRMSADTLSARRRAMFHRKVQQGREDSRWSVRAEDLARMDYMAQRRAWEVEQSRSAPPTWYAEELEDEHDLETRSLGYRGGTQLQALSQSALSRQERLQQERDEEERRRELEMVLRREDEELEALLSLGYEDQSGFGSDEEDYDSLFMDLAEPRHDQNDSGHVTSTSSSGPTIQQHGEEDEMDLSMG